MRFRPSSMSVALITAAIGIPLAPLSAQEESEWVERCRAESWREGWRWGDDRVKHCEIREQDLPAVKGMLSVDPGQNGGVAIRGWDRDGMLVRAKIQTYGQSEDAAREIAGRVRIVTAGGTIRAEGPDRTSGRYGGGTWSVSFEVYVPRRSDLALEARNGPLSVRHVTGRMELDVENGPLSLVGVGGEVRARATNGPLHVELEGARWEGTGLDAETVNGPVDLIVPEDYSARLETGTTNGPVHVGFPLTVTIQGRVTQRITTVLGAGGPLVRVVTTNGPLSIRRP